jgi:hypothetical protein
MQPRSAELRLKGREVASRGDPSRSGSFWLVRPSGFVSYRYEVKQGRTQGEVFVGASCWDRYGEGP